MEAQPSDHANTLKYCLYAREIRCLNMSSTGLAIGSLPCDLGQQKQYSVLQLPALLATVKIKDS